MFFVETVPQYDGRRSHLLPVTDEDVVRDTYEYLRMNNFFRKYESVGTPAPSHRRSLLLLTPPMLAFIPVTRLSPWQSDPVPCRVALRFWQGLWGTLRTFSIKWASPPQVCPPPLTRAARGPAPAGLRDRCRWASVPRTGESPRFPGGICGQF